jgi:hypothetical protein
MIGALSYSVEKLKMERSLNASWKELPVGAGACSGSKALKKDRDLEGE